jgi:hypothetical protein
MLTPDALEDAFMEIGLRAREEGKVIDLAVYGGSALMLASNFRISTRDVDAVAVEEQDYVERLAAEIGAQRGWPGDWLNDGVRTYLSPKVHGLTEHHELFRAYPSEQAPGLRIFLPSAEYVLAMKLMAMRIDAGSPKLDIADIVNLLEVVGLRSEDATIEFAAGFYPEARISGRLRLGIRELWRMRKALVKDGDEPPTYLGRGRSPA